MVHIVEDERGFVYGPEGGAAYGPEDAEDGGTYGPQRPQRYRARLTAVDGLRQTVEPDAVDITFEHTAISDCALEMPRIPGLDRFRHGEMTIFYGDRRLFTATVEKFPGPGTGATATLAGRGPARSLARGSLSVTYSSRDAHDAIAEVWRDHTDFSATVFTPNSPTTLSDFSSEGTPLEVLQDLHEQAGMRFTVQHLDDGAVVESYVASERQRSHSWTVIEHGADGDVTEYANRVEVYGGTKSGGGRAFGAAEDTTEINDVTGGETITWRVDDSSITTDADAQARAESVLAERIAADSLSGTLEIVPALVLPGYYYDIPEWERDGTVPTLSVDKVQIQESPGEATATLEVNAPDGPVDVLGSLRKETARLNQP